jgi:cobalt-zinc-cadmium resistance protein CzcA
MFHPMAQTVVLALLAAMLLSITAVPAAVALLIRKPKAHAGARVIRVAERLYRPALLAAIRHRVVVAVGATALVAVAAVMATRMGSEFLPSLDEGDIGG